MVQSFGANRRLATAKSLMLHRRTTLTLLARMTCSACIYSFDEDERKHGTEQHRAPHHVAALHCASLLGKHCLSIGNYGLNRAVTWNYTPSERAESRTITAFCLLCGNRTLNPTFDNNAVHSSCNHYPYFVQADTINSDV